jgi:hypothetical protein
MRTLRIYVGHGFTPRVFVRDLLESGEINGATITPGFGYWVDDDGTLFDEDADIITFVVNAGSEEYHLITLAREHAYRTGEQSIMVEDHAGSVRFFEALP